MGIVYVEDTFSGARTEIGEAYTIEDALTVVKDYLDDEGKTPTYTRHWRTGVGSVKIDIGSYTECFIWEE